MAERDRPSAAGGVRDSIAGTEPTSTGGVQPPALEGSIDRITFSSADDGYTVARLHVDDRPDLATVVGRMPGVAVGSEVRLWGRWTTHSRFGRQFEIDRYEEVLPTTVDGIRRYLGSGLVKGVGPVTAQRIVDHFGAETLEILDRDPGRITEVPHVGRIRGAKISEAWMKQQHVKAIMLFLQSHGVSSGLAARIYKRYGDGAAGVLRDDPYVLAQDMHGVGFLTADQIARSLGLAADSPRRMDAGIVFALAEMAGQGHVFAPEDGLLSEAARLLRVDQASIAPGVDRLVNQSAVITENVSSTDGPDGEPIRAVYLPELYQAEVETARRLRGILDCEETRLGAFRSVDWSVALQWLEARLPYAMAERQRQAVVTALSRKVCVVTGGPGTGKTTALRGVLALLRARKATVALAAPTGRAAKRMEETTGVPAKTIHRLLEVKPAEGFRFDRNEDNPIDADLVVIDEVSMVDCLLMEALVRALHPASHLLLVGDADQLPSVGPGNVLHDLISSGALPVITLDHIFRQDSDSLIVTNAHRINEGQMPLLAKGEGDFFLFAAEDQEQAADRVVDVVSTRIPARFGLDPVNEIQVLSPMHRGAAGVTALNERLQQTLNPPAPNKLEVGHGGMRLRAGDKVMQIRNNYSRDVFNGDLGRITAIDAREQTMEITFEGRAVDYDFGDLDEVVLAYACTTHKSQGAEYPAVVMTLLPSHYVMLQRNLLYTGVTRARRLCVIVGSRKALAMAISNDKVAKRHTMLDRRLSGSIRSTRVQGEQSALV